MSLILISWRSLWRNTRRTIISVSAIAMGLALAIFMLAMAEGVYVQMIADAVRMGSGHFTLQHPEYQQAPAIDLVVDDTAAMRARLEGLDGVKGTKVLVLGQGVAKTGTNTTGVAIFGVEPALERKTSPLAEHIIEGEYLSADDGRKVVIGKKMANRLKLSVGKKLVLASTDTTGEMTEDLVRVKGIFSMGAAELDGHLAQVPIAFARKFYHLGPDQATQVGAVMEDPDRRTPIMKAFEPPAGVAVLPWEQVMPELANYVKLDRGSNQVFQAVIIFLCLFTIFNTIVMSVLERSREFAVMLALGTSRRRVRYQIIVESTLLAVLGIAVGLGLGGGVALYYAATGLDLSGMMGESELDVSGFAMDPTIYPELTSGMVLALSGTVLAAAILISLYAMRRLRDINLATVLR